MQNIIKFYLSVLLILFGVISGECQLSIQNSPLYISDSGLVFVSGSVYYKDTVRAINNGSWELKGDWVNESGTDTLLFVPGGRGSVIFSGDIQNVAGLTTRFPNLIMTGTGTKFLHVATFAENSLSLDAVELNLYGNVMNILSSNPAAVKSIHTGYVNSSDNIKGRLAWAVQGGNSYEFPMGDAIGLFRYRPLSVVPDGSGVVSVQFQNYNPLNDGYNPMLFDVGNLNKVNDKFYHTMKFDSVGTLTGANIMVPFNSVDDGNFETLASWQNNTIGWGIINSLTPILSSIVTSDRAIQSERNISLKAGNMAVIGLANKLSDIFIPNVITPNGDGKNDKFVVVGLTRYPGSSIEIYNRWDNMVYRSENYANDWDGNGLVAGTYYYVLKLRKPTGIEVKKGWILLMK